MFFGKLVIEHRKKKCFYQQTNDEFEFLASLWSEFFYLYLPIILIMACNLTFFTLTFMKIRAVQKEMASITKEEDSKVHRANLDQEKAK